MKNTVFTGAGTALVTPLTKDGVDFGTFADLIEWQIAEGIDALVIAGTTGEGSTLSDEEHRAVLKFASEQIRGRVPVVAGTGSNDTAYAIDLTKYACEVGCDAMLLVTPYYNKATQPGLIKMFTEIADKSAAPVILYNVPSRTGVNIAPTTYKALADHPNIVAIKEANGNIVKLVETAMLVEDRMDIYSGDDDQIVPIMAMGGQGVISVLSNVAPKETHDICQLYFDGKVKESAALQIAFTDLADALFCETNPIPVKTAMRLMGYAAGPLRLPLSEMEPENLKKLETALKAHGLI